MCQPYLFRWKILSYKRSKKSCYFCFLARIALSLNIHFPQSSFLFEIKNSSKIKKTTKHLLYFTSYVAILCKHGLKLAYIFMYLFDQPLACHMCKLLNNKKQTCEPKVNLNPAGQNQSFQLYFIYHSL